MSRRQHVIGIDIGGTKIAAALVERDGECYELTQVSTPARQGAAVILAEVIRVADGLLKLTRQQGDEVVAVGIGTAGQVNSDTGIVIYAVDTLRGWTGTALGAEVERALGLPVIVENDVNAMALGEVRFGAGRGLNSALYAAIGTGIGGALILNGHLWHGVNWSAGEVGHAVVDWDGDRMCNCGQTGHLEAYASGPAIAKAYYHQRGLPESGDLHPVVEVAQAGDEVAIAVIAEGAHILGMMLAGMATVFDPEALILGGGVAQLGALWWTPFEAAVRANPLPAAQHVAIRRAELGTKAVLVGAAALAWERVTA